MFLSITDAFHISTVLTAASSGQSIKWSPDDGDTVFEGTARSIGTATFGLATCDVRDMYLRVTDKAGFDHALQVRDVMLWIERGLFFTH